MKLVTSTIGALALAAFLTACNSRAAGDLNNSNGTPDGAAAAAPAGQAAPAADDRGSGDKRAEAGAEQAQPVGSTGSTAKNAVAKLFGGEPEYREVTIPAGTVLPLDLETAVGSDTSKVEDPVRATLRRAIRIEGTDVLPAGTAVKGYVSAARRPGRVKGRGYIALRFNEVAVPGNGTTRISTKPVGHLAPATKEKDALKVIAPAAGGAVLGRVIGGKSGAGKGAVIGGAAGTGYVLATRGQEARLGRGANLSVTLTAPVTVRLPKDQGRRD